MQLIVRRKVAELTNIIESSAIQNHYDFSNSQSLTVVSSKISAIQDQGTEGLSLSQSTDNQRPFLISNGLNGRTVAEFGITNDGSLNDSLSATTSNVISASYSIFLVARASDTAGTRHIFMRRRSANGILYSLRYSAAEIPQISVQNSSGTSFTFTGTSINNLNWKILCFSRNNSNNTFSITQNGDNAASQTNSTAPHQANPMTVEIGGDVHTGTSVSYRGQCAEIITLNRVVTSTEELAITGILAHKWGLQSSLPSSNFYRILPPYF